MMKTKSTTCTTTRCSYISSWSTIFLCLLCFRFVPWYIHIEPSKTYRRSISIYIMNKRGAYMVTIIKHVTKLFGILRRQRQIRRGRQRHKLVKVETWTTGFNMMGPACIRVRGTRFNMMGPACIRVWGTRFIILVRGTTSPAPSSRHSLQPVHISWSESCLKHACESDVHSWKSGRVCQTL